MPPNSRAILPGTTRGVVEEMAARAAIHCRVAPISEAQLRAADEIWLSAATREVQPVTALDGQPSARGKPGPLGGACTRAAALQAGAAGTPW